MTQGRQTRRWRLFANTLGFKLSAMVLVALVPLGLAALAQARLAQRNSYETLYTAVSARTLEYALPELHVIRGAQITAQVLAAAQARFPQGCDETLRRWPVSERRVSRVVFMPVSGLANCNSTGEVLDFAAAPRFAEIITSRIPLIFRDSAWSPTDLDGLSLTSPVIASNGDILGFVLLSLPDQSLMALRRQDSDDSAGEGPLPRPQALLISNREDEILYSVLGRDGLEGLLPRDRSIAPVHLTQTETFSAASADGIRRLYAAVPLGNDLNLLGVWTAPDNAGFITRHVMPYIFPALMWLAGLTVTILGVEHLVTRHIRRLSKAMRDFAEGDRLYPEIALDGPPAEIGDLADTYAMMTAAILRDGAELENLVRQKAELLREVHHRTGNSLQLIASFLRMHRRETQDPSVRAVIDDLHHRVMALSTVHLGLYRMAGGSAVAVDQLMADVLSRVDLMQGRTGRKGAIETQLQPLRLSPRQAVPLALLLVELLSSFRSAEAEDQPVRISLNARPGPSGGHVVAVEVSGPIDAKGRLTGELGDAPAVIGARLIRGFVAQLPGELTISSEGERVKAQISFPIQEDSGEPLNSPTEPADPQGWQPKAGDPPAFKP